MPKGIQHGHSTPMGQMTWLGSGPGRAPDRVSNIGQIEDPASFSYAVCRRAPLGTDSLGRDYWYHHFYNTTGLQSGMRAVVEAPLHANLPVTW